MNSNACYVANHGTDYGRRDYQGDYFYNSYTQPSNTFIQSQHYNYSQSPIDCLHKRQRTEITRTRSAANLRERKRMRCINEAFEGLRKHIPTLPYEKRLSKVDTLRLAICYINFLNELVTKDTTKQPYEKSGTKYNFPMREEENGKVVILNTTKDKHTGMTLIRGHSLSWSFDRDEKKQLTRVKTAKTWWPENGDDNIGRSK